MKKLFIACLLLFSLARAGDSASLEVQGFSRDGRYLVFEQYGFQDGSGFPYSSVHVVDVKKNVLLWQTERVIEQDQGTLLQARSMVRGVAKSVLARYKLLSALPGSSIGIAANGYFISGKKLYQLQLKTNRRANTTCSDGMESLLELKLSVDNKTRVLQKDSQLPAARTCALGYKLHHVHVFGQQLAVFLTRETPGFEGSDLRWMVVTGTL